MMNRIEKWTARVEEEQAEIARLQEIGAYKFGHKNPRGREIARQIKRANARLDTARARLRAAEQAAPPSVPGFDYAQDAPEIA